MSSDKSDLIKLSLIIGDYASPEKSKREESEKQLKELREKNFGLLLQYLLELPTMNEISQDIKLTCLVLLRKIIEVDSYKWEKIESSIKQKIKLSSLNIIDNEKYHFNKDFLNKAISVVEQILSTIIDNSEEWPELMNIIGNIYHFNYIKDTSKIYIIVKLLIQSVAFISDKLTAEINKLNNFFSPIFQYDVITNNDLNILELKVLICSFYSNFLTYNVDNLDFFSLNGFAINNIIRTLSDCLLMLNKGGSSQIEKIISDLLDSTEFLNMGSLQFFPESQVQLCQLYNSIIELKKDDIDLEKIKNQSFQRILDILLLKTLPKNELENSIKKYLDNLFQYCFHELNSIFNESNIEFSNISGNYTTYEKVPKVNYDVINFLLDITSKLIDEDEKNIIKELSKSLLSNNNIIYKYCGLMIFPQIIESYKKFSEVESFIPLIISNLNNENNQIRFASAYCTCYFIINYKQHFIKNYSKEFISGLINYINKEKCKHTKCEMILLFNTYISHLDEEFEDEANDDTESGDELEEKNNINNNENNINDNLTVKDYMYNNCQGVFEFLFQIFNDSLNNDTQFSLIKEIILNSILICIDFYGEKCKPFAIKFIEYLAKYLDSIYMNKKSENLYIGLLNAISSFGKYEEDYIAQFLPSLFKCLEEILKNIKDKTPNLNHFHTTLTNLLPVIINKNTDLIPLFLKDIIDLLEYSLNQDNDEEDSNMNFIEDINSSLKVLNQSIEILEDKCINFIQPIESIILKINKKYKNNPDFHITIGSILYNIIKIIYEEKNIDKNNVKKISKNYLDIIAEMLKNELKTSNYVILTEDFNKILEYIISFMEQNELEQIFQGVIDLFNNFEEKRIKIIKKKNKKDNEKEEKEENKNNEEELSSLDEDEEDNTDQDIINYLNKNILNIEQALENFSLIIENILKYGNKAYLNNIYNVLYSKIIPSLINSQENNPLLTKYPNNLKIAANLIDDIFEYSNFNSLDHVHIENLINILINYSQNSKANIRQSAAYGLGIFIKLSDINNIYPKYSEKILSSLKNSFELYYKNKSNDILSREEGLAFDNYISSIGKAISYKNLLDKTYIYFWIENLPLKYDETEMEEGHDILCEFILKDKHKIVNFDEMHIYKLIKIFIEIYKESLSNGDIDKKIKLIIKNKEEFRNTIDKIYNEYKNQVPNKIITKYIGKLEELTK